MPRRGSLARRSAPQWGIRLLLATIAAAVAALSVAYTLAASFKSHPAYAHALAPNDGQITARLSQSYLTAKARAEDFAKAAFFARLALRQDPTAVRAVAALGMSAQARGDMAAARRLFGYAEKLSRRDLQTQLWAIEDAVSRNDIAGALQHYDIALRTSRVAPDLLFPVLSAAIADPAVRSSLISILAKGPGWGLFFSGYVAGKGPYPRATASLFTGLRRRGVALSPEVTETTINSLIGVSAFEDAWNFYASVRPGVDRRTSRDPRFALNLSTPTPFDWRPMDDTGITASIQRGEKGGIFDFSVPPSVGGRLLQQLQMLPPGDYRLEGHSIGIDQPENSRPYWVLTCRDGRELGRIILPNSAQANGSFSGRFSVPAGCPVQTLTLTARPSDLASGVSGELTEVRLHPEQ